MLIEKIKKVENLLKEIKETLITEKEFPLFLKIKELAEKKYKVDEFKYLESIPGVHIFITIKDKSVLFASSKETGKEILLITRPGLIKFPVNSLEEIEDKINI